MQRVTRKEREGERGRVTRQRDHGSYITLLAFSFSMTKSWNFLLPTAVGMEFWILSLLLSNYHFTSHNILNVVLNKEGLYLVMEK